MKPFIHSIYTPFGTYIYDVNQHSVLKLSSDAQDSIKKHNYDNSEIAELLQLGYFKENPLVTINHPFTNQVEDILSNNINNITLQLTQACNFFCRYCSFSGNGILDRVHNSTSMTWETAKAALDFLLKHSGEAKTLSVSFYGGEPLLKFDVIKRCVDYLKMKSSKKLFFYMTTNISLLTDEVIVFLKENNFEILISFDGPERIQNKNRKFAADGSGTYKKVYSIMQGIVEKHPEYVEKITINAVVDPEESAVNLSEFFRNDPVLKMFKIQFSPLDQSHVELSYYIDQDKISSEKFERLMYLFKLANVSKNERAGEKQFYSEFELFQNNLNNKFLLPTEYHPKGQCVVGYRKLFVDTEGNLWPCEKISINSRHLCIGNVFEDFDYTKVRELLNIGKLNGEKCKNCWCIRFCDICLAAIDGVDCLSENIKLDLCRSTCKEINTKLSEMITVENIKNNMFKEKYEKQ